ncbi:MAG: serpin family protein [Mucilaginibacter sp.]
MKKQIRILSIAFIVVLSASCKKDSSSINAGKNLVLTAEQQQMVIANNVFNFKLFNTIAAGNTGNANLLLSPFSVSIAMAMTNNGSKGDTYNAINTAMNFTGFTSAQLNPYYNNLITNLPQLDPHTSLQIANSIWYGQSISVVPQFLQTNTNYYNALVQSLDFNNPASVNTINNWVNSQTKGKIPTIVNQIPSNVVMYLINAIYFKSTWANRFDATQTNKQTFYLADNTQVQTDFMNGKISYNAYSDTTASVFELPYSNNKYSMVIAMPGYGKSVASLAATIDQVKWQQWMSKLSPVTGQISMPKFSFSYDVLLNNALITLGMGNAFTSAADFGNISTTEPLQITAVNHKTFIEVDENGTTAAAATSVVIGTTAALPPTINHPFIFAIREMSSGLILFTGIVNNPLNN